MSKVSWKDIFEGFQLSAFENKSTFIKKAVLNTSAQMDCKARHVLCDLFSSNRRNGSDMTFVAGATKIDLKNLEIYP